MNNRPHISRQLFANVLGRTWVFIANLVFLPVYLNILGTQGYGIIALFLAVSGLIGFLDLGLSPTLSRELNDQSRSRQQRLDLLATYERVFITMSVSIVLLAVFVPDGIVQVLLSSGDLESQHVTIALRLLLIAAVVLLLFNFYIAGIIGIEQQVSGNLTLVSSGIVRSALVVGPLIWFPDPLVFLAWQLFFLALFTVYTRWRLYSFVRADSPLTVSARFDASLLWGNARFTGAVFFVSIAAAINTQVDKLIIGKIWGLEALTPYSLVCTFAQLLVFAVTPISLTVLPRLVRLVSDERNQAKGSAEFILTISHKAMSVIVGVGAAVMMWFGPGIVEIWTAGVIDSDYVEIILTPLVLGYGLLALSVVPHTAALAHKNLIASFYMSGSVILTIPSYWWAISQYGPMGGAWVWCVLQMIVVPTYFIWVRFKLHYFEGALLRAVGEWLIPFVLSSCVCWLLFLIFDHDGSVFLQFTLVIVAALVSTVMSLLAIVRKADLVQLRNMA